MPSQKDAQAGDGRSLDQIKADLDELHKRKIDLADEVLVLNVDGYIGESTRSEIEYALAHGKPIRYLEPTDGDPMMRPEILAAYHLQDTNSGADDPTGIQPAGDPF